MGWNVIASRSHCHRVWYHLHELADAIWPWHPRGKARAAEEEAHDHQPHAVTITEVGAPIFDPDQPPSMRLRDG
jgi:hypothetical protein